MGNNITELVFILDKSGSMSGLEADTIGGFNAMIEKQKKEDSKAFVTTVLFSTSCKVIHDRVDISKMEPMTDKDYQVGGCTALMDAMGDTIKHITRIHKYARPEDVPEHTVFVITTDGMENASRKYSADEIKKMVKHEEEKYGWEFIFLAANIDAVETAESYGIQSDNTSGFRACSEGIGAVYDCVCDALTNLRSGNKLAKGWNDRLENNDSSEIF